MVLRNLTPAYLEHVERVSAAELGDQLAVTIDQPEHLACEAFTIGAVAAALDALYPTDRCIAQ